ncbi:type II toxin-antitoxin system RelE/ParE family toxin [Reyranella sp. CPCC 100927]|nr:type II toxin-antitoxin system RelE/ParE family toxin [Reyranella sp. CPCC 100927]
MNHYTVTFDPTALQDLQQIYDYIGRHAGARTARTYVRRIYDHCLALQTFPERGTRRDDLRPGLRTLGFERRATIVFRLDRRRKRVVILAVAYAGRDVETKIRGGRRRT